MKDIKISIIVPVYNIENYIDNTVDSIRKQTYKNLEIILVDDGSSDNSGKIIDSISKKDSRIITIHQRNGGVTSARLAGIRRASGEWIGFVDGDDYIESEMYEHLVDNAIKYNAQISHCGYQMVFPTHIDYYYNTGRLVKQDKLTGLSDLLAGSFVEPGLCNKLFHKTLFNSLLHGDTIDLSIKNNEDLLMNFILFSNAEQSIYEDFCPYHYMLREGSAATSKINKNKLYDPIKVQKIILEDVGDNEVLSDIIYGRLASIYINGASMKSSKNEPFMQNYIHECRKELKRVKPFFFRSKRNTFEKFKFKLCLFSPLLYRLFHTTYAKTKGTDKKYEVK